jgi:hypothetical protein
VATDTPTRQAQTPRLSSLRVPSDPSLHGLAANAHVMWRLATQGKQSTPMESGNPAEEFKNVCEFMRLYATLRFYQLALLLGTTGSIITALSSNAARTSFARAELLKAGGLIVSLALLVMEFRASSYTHGLRKRGNQLAEMLRFEPFPTSSRWNPLTTSGAGFYLHSLVAMLWLASLFLRLQPGL